MSSQGAVNAFCFIFQASSLLFFNCIESYHIFSLPDEHSIMVSASRCPLRFTEHVVVFINATSTKLGRLIMSVVSPSGTESVILPGRFLDRRSSIYINVTSVQLWGENPVGNWKLVTKGNPSLDTDTSFTGKFDFSWV